MAFMGYETPVEMPSMGIYNTDLMKMYIAGVKDQYEKGQEEMKDFMKLYGDFYSPVPGATEAYNNMTIGGARDMINQMLANGIDPYKSPEARAAISRYIASVPTGAIKLLEQQKEDYSKYQDAVRDAMARGTYNEPMEKYYLQKEGLDNFLATSRNPDGTIKVNDWTRLAPAKFSTLESITNPFFKDLEKIDFVGNDPKHPGYSLYKVADDVLADALRGGVDAVRNNPNGDFYIYQAEKKLNNAGITRETNPGNYDQLVAQLLAQDVKDANAQAWQTKSDWDKYGQEMRGYAQDIKMEGIRHNNRMIESGHKWNPKTKQWVAPGGGDGDQQSPDGISVVNRFLGTGYSIVQDKTGKAGLKDGQTKLMLNHINTQKGNRSNARHFLENNFKQTMTPETFSQLVTGVSGNFGQISYLPGRDSNRLLTYTEVANHMSTNKIQYGNPKYKGPFFKDNNTIKDGQMAAKFFNALYEEKADFVNGVNPIIGQHRGSCYAVLLDDGYEHLVCPITYNVDDNVKTKINGKEEVLLKGNYTLLYDLGYSVNPVTQRANPESNAEAALIDRRTTHDRYSVTANSADQTLNLTGGKNKK